MNVDNRSIPSLVIWRKKTNDQIRRKNIQYYINFKNRIFINLYLLDTRAFRKNNVENRGIQSFIIWRKKTNDFSAQISYIKPDVLVGIMLKVCRL